MRPAKRLSRDAASWFLRRRSTGRARIVARAAGFWLSYAACVGSRKAFQGLSL